MLLHAIFVSMLTSLAGGASNIAHMLKILALGLIIVSTAQFEVDVDCQDHSQLFLISHMCCCLYLNNLKKIPFNSCSILLPELYNWVAAFLVSVSLLWCLVS